MMMKRYTDGLMGILFLGSFFLLIVLCLTGCPHVKTADCEEEAPVVEVGYVEIIYGEHETFVVED